MKKACVEVTGRVKWFDKGKGFGFLTCDGLDGDVFVHRSILAEHGLKSVPEGATLVVEAYLSKRGMQTDKVLSIDTTTGAPPRPTEAPRSKAGAFEPVEVKWYDPNRGYGFVIRGDADAFLHAEVVEAAGLQGLFDQGDTIEARIADGTKGLIAVEVRLAETQAIAA